MPLREHYGQGSHFYNIQTPLVDARVGNNMVARRSGYAYYKFEKELMKKFLKYNFINPIDFSFYLSLKLFLRILTVKVLT